MLNSAPGSADETYICDDGRSITIDSSNRDAAKDHPCVKSWFIADAARRTAQEQGERAGPKSRPVLRALALRNLQRPSYLFWTKPAPVRIAAYTRKTAAPQQRAYVKNAPSLRIRFRRR